MTDSSTHFDKVINSDDIKNWTEFLTNLINREQSLLLFKEDPKLVVFVLKCVEILFMKLSDDFRKVLEKFLLQYIDDISLILTIYVEEPSPELDKKINEVLYWFMTEWTEDLKEILGSNINGNNFRGVHDERIISRILLLRTLGMEIAKGEIFKIDNDLERSEFYHYVKTGLEKLPFEKHELIASYLDYEFSPKTRKSLRGNIDDLNVKSIRPYLGMLDIACMLDPFLTNKLLDTFNYKLNIIQGEIIQGFIQGNINDEHEEDFDEEEEDIEDEVEADELEESRIGETESLTISTIEIMNKHLFIQRFINVVRALKNENYKRLST